MSTSIPALSSTESPVLSEPLEFSLESNYVTDSSSVSGSDSVTDDDTDSVSVSSDESHTYVTYVSAPSDAPLYGGDSVFLGYEVYLGFFACAIVAGFILCCFANFAGLAIGIVSKLLRKEV